MLNIETHTDLRMGFQKMFSAGAFSVWHSSIPVCLVYIHTHAYTHISQEGRVKKGDNSFQTVTNLGIKSRAYHSKFHFITLQNSEFLHFVLVTVGIKRLVARNVLALCQFTCISSLW